jgi:valyl-tRNA synthetase
MFMPFTTLTNSTRNQATKEVDNALEAREFSRATQVIYRYIYDELCDVFIENSKAIIQDGTPDEKQSATNTLYTAIEGALLLIHPFMCFLSEELWQRLPRRKGDSTPSITIAKYPEYDSSLEDHEAEKTYGLVLSCSKGVRSLIAENKMEQAKFLIQASDDGTYETLQKQLSSIRSLSGKGVESIEILSQDQPTPAKSYCYLASFNVVLYLEIQKAIDVDEEISKAQIKLKKTSQAYDKQLKLMNAEDFKTKVNEAVQETEKEKLDELQSQVRNYEKSVEMFSTLKLKG